MANGNEIEKDKLPEPTFIEQANTLIDKRYEESKVITDSKYGPGLNPWDHKLWVAIMDLHISHVNDNLSKKYTEKIAEFYKPIMEALEKLGPMAEDIAQIKEEQEKEKKKITEHDEWMKRKKLRIEALELNMKFLQADNIRKVYDELIESKEIFIEAQTTFSKTQEAFTDAQEAFTDAKPIVKWIKQYFTRKMVFVYGGVLIVIWFILHWLATLVTG